MQRRGRPPRSRPVFVFGLPRSGTTLVEQVISSHSGIHGAGELRFARQTFEAIPGVLGRPGPPIEHVTLLDGPGLKKLAAQHLERLTALAGDRPDRVVDKMPDNYMYVGLMSVVFPRATFIHCRRDLRDIAVSCWMTDFRSIRWANDLEHVASRFRQSTADGPLARPCCRGADPARRLRGDRDGPRVGRPPADLRLRARLGARLPGVPPQRAADPHGERHPVPPAGLPGVRSRRWKNYESTLGEMFAGCRSWEGRSGTD